MIEILLGVKQTKKYFGIYYGDNIWQLVPKNKEIIPFLKYFKDFYHSDENISYKKSGNCKLILENKNFDNIEEELIRDVIYDNEKIIFEFANEEEAFYFRLKLL